MIPKYTPGDMVFGSVPSKIRLIPEKYQFKFGIVIAIKDNYQKYHYGCDNRISVFWTHDFTIKDECVCGIISLKDWK